MLNMNCYLKSKSQYIIIHADDVFKHKIVFISVMIFWKFLDSVNYLNSFIKNQLLSADKCY